MSDVLILGCGFTGRRVARRLVARGLIVRCTTRESLNLEHPAALSDLRALVTPGIRVLHSVPTLAGELDRLAVAALLGAARVVYLSTTAVYGDAEYVDETTPAAPRSDRAHARLRTEQAVLDGPWPALVLRPAAIYGPGRITRARRSGDSSHCVSRIHAEDLAAHAEAALLSEVTGAWPVADGHPCPSSEIAEFLANSGTANEFPRREAHEDSPPATAESRCPRPNWPPTDLSPAPPAPVASPTSHRAEGSAICLPTSLTPRHTPRRVDGSAIRRLLGITLRYPSWHTGIPAALEEQRRACHDRDFQ